MNLNKIINNNYCKVFVVLILFSIVFFIIYYLYNKKNKYIKNKFNDVNSIKYLDLIPNYAGSNTVGKSIDNNGNIIWYCFGDNEYNSLGINTGENEIIEPREIIITNNNKIYDIKLFYENSFIKYIHNNINKWLFSGYNRNSGIDFKYSVDVDPYVMKHNPLLDNSIDIIGSDTLFYAKKMNSEGKINWYVFGDDYLELMGFDKDKLFDDYYNPLPTTPTTTNNDYIFYNGTPLYNKNLDDMIDIKASWDNFFYGKKIDENNNIKWYVWGNYEYCGIVFTDRDPYSTNGAPLYNPLLDNFIDILVTGYYTIGKKIVDGNIKWYFWNDEILTPTHITEFDIYKDIIINDDTHFGLNKYFGLNKEDNQWYFWSSIPIKLEETQDLINTTTSSEGFTNTISYEFTYENKINITEKIMELQNSSIDTTTITTSTNPIINPELKINVGYEFTYILDKTHNKWYDFNLVINEYVIEYYANFISQPSTTQPSTTQPSTTQPSTTQPSTTQPSTTQPSTTQPSIPQPSINQLSITQPQPLGSNDFNIGMMLKGSNNEGNLNDFLSKNTMLGNDIYISPNGISGSGFDMNDDFFEESSNNQIIDSSFYTMIDLQ